MGCCFTTICRESSIPEIETFPNGYTGIKLLHQGKSRSVYTCSYQNRRVCFKIIPLTSSTWRNEIRLLEYCKDKNLPSPNLIKAFNKDNFSYILYDYISGIDLFAYIKKRKPFSEAFIRRLSYNLLSIIHKYHMYGIWHLDLKPENILCVDGKIANLKLIDFGQSVICSLPKINTPSLGTAGYAAPELADGICYAKSDIWSFGIIVYILFFSEYPLPIDQKSTVVEHIEKYRQDVWVEKFKKFSQESFEFINQCLVVDVNKRSGVNELLKHSWFLKNL